MSDWEDEIVLECDEVLAETERALLCVIDGEEKWVPKSQISDNSEVYEMGTTGDLIVSRWWAGQNGYDD